MKKDKFGILLFILLSSIFVVLFGILLLVRVCKIDNEIILIFKIMLSVLLGLAFLFLILSACLLSRTMAVLKNSFALFASMIGLVCGILSIALEVSTKDGIYCIVFAVLLGIFSIIGICVESFMILALVNKDRK